MLVANLPLPFSQIELTPPSSRSSQHDIQGDPTTSEALTINGTTSSNSAPNGNQSSAQPFGTDQTQVSSIQVPCDATIPQNPSETRLDHAEASVASSRKESTAWISLGSAHEEEKVYQEPMQPSCCSGSRTLQEQPASIGLHHESEAGRIESHSTTFKTGTLTPPNGSCCQPSFGENANGKNLQNSDERFFPNLNPDPTFSTNGFSALSSPFPDISSKSQNSSSVYTFPPPLSTWEHPLTPEVLARIQGAEVVSSESIDSCSVSRNRWSSFSRSESFQLPSELYSTPLISPQETLIGTTLGLPNTPQIWPPINALHVCRCGADCSCPMCPAHPYNKASAEALQSMAQDMNFVDAGSSSLNFNTQMSDSGGVLSPLTQDSTLNLKQFVAATLANDQNATLITRSTNETIPFSPQEAPVFTTAEYYHLYYPSAWIENNSHSNPT